MLRAATIGLGRWGRILIESAQTASEVIRFHQGATLDPSAVTAFEASIHSIKSGIRVTTAALAVA